MDMRDSLKALFLGTHTPFFHRKPFGPYGHSISSALDVSNQLSAPTSPVSGHSGLYETGMYVGAAVVFSVNPPSPLESELCSDEQESILRNWHTGGPVAERPQEESDRIDACTKFEPEVMDHGIMMSSSRPCSAQQSAAPARARNTSQAVRSDSTNSVLVASGGPSKGEMYGKRSSGSGRRSSSGDVSRKSELYKTELCISVSTGLPCKYGENCQFAHSAKELQHIDRHPRYKTQLCTSFQSQGYCKYNDRCTFIHHAEEARIPPPPARRGSIPERSARRSSTGNSTSGSGSATPLIQEPKNERLRTMSDPGLAYSNISKAAPSTSGVSYPFPSLPEDSAAIGPNIATAERLFGCVEYDGFASPPSCRRHHEHELQQYRTLIAQPSSINAAFEVPQRHHDKPSHSTTPTSFSCGPLADVPYFDVVRYGGGDLGMATYPTHPLAAMQSHILPVMHASNPWSQDARADDDEQWASKLAYYISTPQNDFDI
ncbi:hypothetical protein BGZ99_006952 [Dissophora globulifera]|uniref:C3H1-type domain-containing protein n=1 Tax=Dissophora globulifera TaxID=979702 RepID=A0A9P6URE4_9FUNG|nr:hypothetical protein BGZ99_006952 [Dissophora globulifera]